MQQPPSLPHQPHPAQPARQRNPKKLLLLGCGLPLGALFGLLLLGVLLGDDTASNTSSNTSSKPGATELTGAQIPARYFGTWTGQDGTTLSIRGDGKGDFNGGNVKIEGGGWTLDEPKKSLKISSFFGIGREWKLEKPPADGENEMKLSGLVFRRTSGFSPASASDSAFAPDKVPANVKDLAKTTNLAFRAGVRAKNLGPFFAQTSQLWRDQTDEKSFKAAFAPLTTGKLVLPDWGDSEPILSPAPFLDREGILRVQGTYPTRPLRAHFALRFVPENNQWKLLGINWNFKR